MDSRKAWLGKPNGEEPNDQMKQFNGFNKGQSPMPQSDQVKAGKLAMHISAKHNTGELVPPHIGGALGADTEYK